MKRTHFDKINECTDHISCTAVPQEIQECTKYKPVNSEEADLIYKKLIKQSEIRSHNKNYKKPWTDDEIRLLYWSVDKYCKERVLEKTTLSAKDWEKISSLIPGRNITQCHYKWSMSQKHLTNKTPWSLEEDNYLTDIIHNKGLSSWSIIAREINDSLRSIRSGKQCRERWLNHLSPNISKYTLPTETHGI